VEFSRKKPGLSRRHGNPVGQKPSTEGIWDSINHKLLLWGPGQAKTFW